jgi:hypothetical protein
VKILKVPKFDIGKLMEVTTWSKVSVLQ